jgi:hypothetical protein
MFSPTGLQHSSIDTAFIPTATSPARKPPSAADSESSAAAVAADDAGTVLTTLLHSPAVVSMSVSSAHGMSPHLAFATAAGVGYTRIHKSHTEVDQWCSLEQQHQQRSQPPQTATGQQPPPLAITSVSYDPSSAANLYIGTSHGTVAVLMARFMRRATHCDGEAAAKPSSLLLLMVMSAVVLCCVCCYSQDRGVCGAVLPVSWRRSFARGLA